MRIVKIGATICSNTWSNQTATLNFKFRFTLSFNTPMNKTQIKKNMPQKLSLITLFVSIPVTLAKVKILAFRNFHSWTLTWNRRLKGFSRRIRRLWWIKMSWAATKGRSITPCQEKMISLLFVVCRNARYWDFGLLICKFRTVARGLSIFRFKYNERSI